MNSTTKKLKRENLQLKVLLSLVITGFCFLNFVSLDNEKLDINCPPPQPPMSALDMSLAQEVTDNFQAKYPNAPCAFQISNGMIYHAFNEILKDDKKEIEGFRCYFGQSSDTNMEYVVFRALAADGSELNRSANHEFKGYVSMAHAKSPYTAPCPVRCDQAATKAGSPGRFN